MSDRPLFSAFLSELKRKYLDDVKHSKAPDWVVVMGNEAGDLDSVVSSLAYSWLENQVNKRPTIALARFDHGDLHLRKENIHALKLAKLSEDAQEMLCLDDLPDSTNCPFHSHDFALVDHNILDSRFSKENPHATVIALVDHHEDEGLYRDTAKPRIIAPAGSCSSHVAHLCTPDIPPELASLLMCAILIDTNGLKSKKALAVDKEAIAFLGPLSTLASSIPSGLATDDLVHVAAIRDLTDDLNARKEDINDLDAWDLLRRDYKEYVHAIPWAHPETRTTIKVGLSTAMSPLQAWATEGRLVTVIHRWMETRGLGIHGVLTAYSNDKGKKRRQQVWFVRAGTEVVADTNHPVDMPLSLDALCERLFMGLEDSQELELEEKVLDLAGDGHLQAGIRFKVYKQKNAGATRKVTAPVLKKILEAVGKLQ